MTSPVAPLRRVTAFLLASGTALSLFVAAYVVVGVALVVTNFTINDEGLLTHYWASWLRRDFVPVFFFQKVKPVVCLLYAPVSAAGLRATLIAHVAFAAAAIPMLMVVARSLGQPLPNLPALTVVLSPLYFYGAPAGISNVDGVVAIILTLYLLCARQQPFAAGLVLGMLPWVRYELTVFCAVMAVYALATKSERRMLLGMAVFPLAYMAAGAFYHGDALWIINLPASLPSDPENPMWRGQPIGLRYLLEPAMAITPLAAIAAALPRGVRRVEWALLAYAVLSALAMNILPILQIGYFGSSPRYSLHLLPALALLIGRAVSPWWGGERPRPAALLGMILVGIWMATRQQNDGVVWTLLVTYALILAAAWMRSSTVAVTVAVGLALTGPFLPLRTELAVPKYLDPLVAWLQAHPEDITGPIYTNGQIVAPLLAQRLPDADVRYVAGFDVLAYVELANADNGQRDRIRDLMAVDLYGKMIAPPIAPGDLPNNALLALRSDRRLDLLFPPAIWSSRLDVLAEGPDYRIARLRPAAAPPRPGKNAE
jgi:hypothetical protein